MIDWALVDQSIAQLGFYTTTTSQLSLIFLTLFIVRKDLGAYRYLIVLFSAVGIAFASSEFITYPILHNHNAGYFFFTKARPFDASNEVMEVMLAIYTGLYATTMSLLAVQFLYRYFAVFDADRLKYFNGYYFFIWVIYAGWFGFQWGAGQYFFLEKDEYSQNYMKEEMRQVYDSDIFQVPCQIDVIYQSVPNSTDSFIRWRNVMSTLNMNFVMAVQYGIMIYCGYQLNHEMEQKISMMSSQMKRLHRQIFKTLVLQITTPTLILFSPLFFVICAPYFNLEISLPTGIFLCGFTLYPALDAFILMYVISDYRNALTKVVKSKRMSKYSP